MKKWLLVLVALLAAAFIATPAMGYISIKETYDGIYDGWQGVLIDQVTPVGWNINLQRQPSGPITTWPDTMVPIYDMRQTDRTFAVWTAYDLNATPGPWIPDYAEFYSTPGYDTWVTIVPVLDKFWEPGSIL